MFCQKKNGIFSKIIKIYLIFLSLQLNYLVLNLLYMEFEREIYLKSAGVLAFVGDSVFSVLVRSRLTLSHDLNAGQLNRLANKLVCAEALFGYWYLTDDKQRMDQAVNLCIGDKI